MSSCSSTSHPSSISPSSSSLPRRPTLSDLTNTEEPFVPLHLQPYFLFISSREDYRLRYFAECEVLWRGVGIELSSELGRMIDEQQKVNDSRYQKFSLCSNLSLWSSETRENWVDVWDVRFGQSLARLAQLKMTSGYYIHQHRKDFIRNYNTAHPDVPEMSESDDLLMQLSLPNIDLREVYASLFRRSFMAKQKELVGELLAEEIEHFESEEKGIDLIDFSSRKTRVISPGFGRTYEVPIWKSKQV